MFFKHALVNVHYQPTIIFFVYYTSSYSIFTQNLFYIAEAMNNFSFTASSFFNYNNY